MNFISNKTSYNPKTNTFDIIYFWFDYKGHKHVANTCPELINQIEKEYARLAQSGSELLFRKEEAGGSNPSAGSTTNKI